MIKKWTWEMIADTLIKEFQNDKYVKGEKMPSENKMAVRFQVPRSEIRKAYERLKELGYVYSMQGYGSFFSGKQEKIRLSMNDESFSKKMRETGINFETRNVGCRRISGDSLIHTMLGVDFGEPVYKITRLRILDGEPAAIHISYVPESLFPRIAEDGKISSSMYDYIHSCGYSQLKTDNAQLTVSLLDKKSAPFSMSKGTLPVLS